VRLAFALFAHLEPDVYIVDEALSVGDVFFQQKCFKRFAELRRQGCTVLLVSHDMEAVMHLCDRGILLNGGKLAAQGDPVSVVHDYFALRGQTFAAVPTRATDAPAVTTPADGLAVPASIRESLEGGRGPCAHAGAGTRATEIVGFAVSDEEGREGWTARSGGRLRFWYLIEAREPCHDLNVGIHFYDRRGILVFAVGSANLGRHLPLLAPGQRLVCALAVTLPLQPGQYTVVPQTGGLTGGIPEPGLLHDRLESLPPVIITPRWEARRLPFYGLVELPVDVSWTEPVRHRAAGGAP
jgi:hypothetical protein